jgi:SAM-dependent methyltransferase
VREEITCSSCGVRGKYVDGIPCFVDPERYEGEPSREEMQRVNRLAREVGWQTAIKEVLPGKSAGIGDESRADFRHIWDLSPDAAILDIGDSWGTIAAALAGAFAHVTVVENIFERARFIALRTRELKLPVDVICADYLHIPLAPGQFDAIALNMTLQARMPDAQGDAREAQLRLLKFAHEALKPSGFICAGVGNRLGWRKLLGSGLRNGKGRTSMLSLAEYRALLREAGYDSVRAFHCWNGCDAPGSLLPLDNRAALRHFVELHHCARPRYWVLRAAACTGLWERCAPEAIFLAEKG